MLKLVEKKNLWFLISVLVISTGIGIISLRAIKSEPVLNFGIDFLGGTSYIIKFDALEKEYQKTPSNKKAININFIKTLRKNLSDFGLTKNTIQITDTNEVIIKTLSLKQSASQEVLSKLRQLYGKIEILEIDFIGPSIGLEFKEQSLAIVMLVSIALLAYITIRFELKYGIAAILALLHDTLVTLTLTAILNIELNTAYVAALLTVLGYSINDTIVIFDRIRENINLHGNSKSLLYIINLSITQTIRRTVNTSLTTLIVISALLFFGGTTIKSFTLILFIGILSGTYSSIFIASPLLLSLGNKSKATS